jgi:hypothetical protein
MHQGAINAGSSLVAHAADNRPIRREFGSDAITAVLAVSRATTRPAPPTSGLQQKESGRTFVGS